MNKYDIIIIGGGISGLNTAYKLLQHNASLKILILEKNNYLGGRIKTFTKTINNHKYIFEEGAGRLNTNHKLFLKLIDEFNLTNNLSKINSDISFRPSGNSSKEFADQSPFTYINKVIKYSKKDTIAELQKYIFIDYAKKILNEQEIKFILDSFGYYKQLVAMNAYDAIKLFDKGMNPKLQFYHLNPGLDIIINALHDKISIMNCKIKLNTNVLNIEYNSEMRMFTIKTSNKTYTSNICVCAIPKPDLLKFNIYNSVKPLLNSINYKSLCRIYSIFKKEDIWFNNTNMHKCTTNNKLRYIIPLDRENGSIMISYSDSKFADYWNKLNEKQLINELKKNITKTFHINMVTPLFTKVCYWKCAIGFWKKNKNSTILSNNVIHPIVDIPLFICGENYSEIQGWIEGALETSMKVVNKIIKL